MCKSLTNSAGQRGQEGGNLFDKAALSVASATGGYRRMSGWGQGHCHCGEPAQTREAQRALHPPPLEGGRAEGREVLEVTPPRRLPWPG